MRRRGYYGRNLTYPIDPNTGSESTSPFGAVVPAHQIPTESEESRQNLIVPIPFDYQTITPTAGLGGFSIGLGMVRQFQTFTVPLGMRGSVDGIFPYLETVAAPGISLVGPRIPNAPGSEIVWHILINGRPDRTYGAINTILAPWQTAMSERMMVSLRSGEQLTVTVDYDDPGALYAYIGIRIKGWFIPLPKEHRGR